MEFGRAPGGAGILWGTRLLVAAWLAGALAACAAGGAERRETAATAATYDRIFGECARERRLRQECGAFRGGQEGERARDVALAGERAFGAGVAVALVSDTTVSNEFLGNELSIAIAGNHRLVWWTAGAGALHRFDGHAYGFSLAGTAGLRLPGAEDWSLLLGAKFLNVSDFYEEEPERPAHHVLGQVGVDYVAVERFDALLRLSLRALLGVQRQRVARFDGAREAVDDRYGFEFGGAFCLALWLR